MATNSSFSAASLAPSSADDESPHRDGPSPTPSPSRSIDDVVTDSSAAGRNDSGTSSMNSRMRFDGCVLGGVRPGIRPAGILAALIGLRRGSRAPGGSETTPAPCGSETTPAPCGSETTPAPVAVAASPPTPSPPPHSARSAALAKASVVDTTPAFAADTSAASATASALATASRRVVNLDRSALLCSGARTRRTHAASILAHLCATRRVLSVSRWSSGRGDTVHSMKVLAPDAMRGARV
mmetsp:Transcript_12825/g.55033  ORF Transcript_12825/g.55033 Transcript_12825/m.55033 type:complete len:240 (+) Transcript_12825:392-1111(+)